ncbi:hypothetical protein AVEN_142516-1 [Araneus ventricosus]|uniref:Uncharacterized protein n=1 Tax=Araneus ventricosus TaxID=182803 RepID=A0A4Y2CIV0_ARAVE|nr:hypothetical protein AVEN_142516-1 [Araneus ventricosus]
MWGDKRLLALERHNLWSYRLVHPGATPTVRRFLENWVTRMECAVSDKVGGREKGPLPTRKTTITSLALIGWTKISNRTRKRYSNVCKVSLNSEALNGKERGESLGKTLRNLLQMENDSTLLGSVTDRDVRQWLL